MAGAQTGYAWQFLHDPRAAHSSGRRPDWEEACRLAARGFGLHGQESRQKTGLVQGDEAGGHDALKCRCKAIWRFSNAHQFASNKTRPPTRPDISISVVPSSQV